MCYQMLTGSVNIDTGFFSHVPTLVILKPFRPQITSVRDGNLFANRVISHWNSLSNSFVSSPFVASFKCKLDQVS